MSGASPARFGSRAPSPVHIGRLVRLVSRRTSPCFVSRPTTQRRRQSVFAGAVPVGGIAPGVKGGLRAPVRRRGSSSAITQQLYEVRSI